MGGLLAWLRKTMNGLFGTGDSQWFENHDFKVDDFPNDTAWVYFLAIVFVGIICILLYCTETRCCTKKEKKFYELDEFDEFDDEFVTTAARCCSVGSTTTPYDDDERSVTKRKEKCKKNKQKRKDRLGKKKNLCGEACQKCCCDCECNPITCMQQETGRCLRATDKRCDKMFDHSKCFCPCSEQCERRMFCDDDVFLKKHKVQDFITIHVSDHKTGRQLTTKDRCSLKVFGWFNDHAVTKLLFGGDGASLLLFAYAVYSFVTASQGFGKGLHFRQAVGTVNALHANWYVRVRTS